MGGVFMQKLKIIEQRNFFKQGFTLLELVVTISIIGIISLIALPKFNDFMAKDELKNAAKELANNLQYIQQLSMNAADASFPILTFNNTTPYGYIITKNTAAIKPMVYLPAGLSFGANSGTVSFRLNGKPTMPGSVLVQNSAKGLQLYVVWDSEGRIRVGASP